MKGTYKPDDVALGNLLKKIAASKGIQVKYIAIEGKIPYYTVYNIFSGKASLKFKHLLVILRILDISMERFMILYSAPFNRKG